MEQHFGRRQEPTWRTDFQRKYLRRLVAMLRRGRIDQRATSLSARSRALKAAADLSLAMTTRGRTAWRCAILRKYLFRLHKSGFQRRVVNSRMDCLGKRKSVSVKARPCKPNADRDISGRQLPGVEYRITGTASRWSRGNCDEEAGRSVISRMQILRAIVPEAEDWIRPFS
uniref:IBH1-like N-terminal domain-containing protein n=1 Tax=Picea sitchensis TaxID=3332 RepID=B8LPM7_PICSI|nr:unknown [Picea sitchensis]